MLRFFKMASLYIFEVLYELFSSGLVKMGVKNFGWKDVKNNSLFEPLASLELFRLSIQNLAQVRRPSLLVLFGNEKRTRKWARNSNKSIDLLKPVVLISLGKTENSIHNSIKMEYHLPHPLSNIVWFRSFKYSLSEIQRI